MAPRLKIGKTGSGDGTGTRTAASETAATEGAGIPKGSGERAARIETQAVGGDDLERIPPHRRGSGAGT